MGFEHESVGVNPDFAELNNAEFQIAGIKASTNEQLPFAYTGYATYLNLLNQQRSKKDQLTPVSETEVATFFSEELAAWEAGGGLDYVRGQLEADPSLTFTVVHQPNIEITGDELKQLNQDFAETQPYKAYIDDTIYDHFSPEALSGVIEGGAPIRSLLIPSKFNVPSDTAENQQTTLEELQKDYPYLVVPALAVAPNFWFTLRANGDLATSKNPKDFAGAYQKTGIRNFDLEAHFPTFQAVPISYVRDIGRPGLYLTDSSHSNPGRIAVGSK
ncbi:MAG TPA: hypothetical protein VMU97_00095 [Candidatus Dormibacteraeota bacterium]|nr:hypothetical protein [Candidatus Dormibacteraeota bacterium]HVA11213.1 hypothetical protein [Candidatus Dormibacteraeota bacterium]